MALTNKTIADSFKDILHVSNSNNGLDGTTRNVLSGEGSTCGLHLSTNNTLIKSASNSATALQVQNASGTNLLEVNTTATIDAVHVFFAPDTTSTNAVSFSMMSYDADLDNSTTSGNLTGGVEIVKSGSATTMASEDDVYYQTLTIVAGDVDTNASSTAGKVIMAFVAQSGTSADLSVQMQVVYHLRI